MTITRDISFTAGATMSLKAIVFDEWTVDDGQRNRPYLDPPVMPYRINGGPLKYATNMRVDDNMSSSWGRITPNDGYILFDDEISITGGDRVTLHAGTWRINLNPGFTLPPAGSYTFPTYATTDQVGVTFDLAPLTVEIRADEWNDGPPNETPANTIEVKIPWLGLTGSPSQTSTGTGFLTAFETTYINALAFDNARTYFQVPMSLIGAVGIQSATLSFFVGSWATDNNVSVTLFDSRGTLGHHYSPPNTIANEIHTVVGGQNNQLDVKNLLTSAQENGLSHFSLHFNGTTNWIYSEGDGAILTLNVVTIATGLAVQRDGDDIVLTWNEGLNDVILEATTDLVEWRAIGGDFTENRYVVPPGSPPQLFYRLRFTP